MVKHPPAGGTLGELRAKLAELEAAERPLREQYEAHCATLAAAKVELERTTDSRRFGEMSDLLEIKKRQIERLAPEVQAAFEATSGQRQVIASTERTAAELRGEAHRLCMRLHEIATQLEELTGDASGLDNVEVLGQRIDQMVSFPSMLGPETEPVPGVLEQIKAHLAWLTRMGRRDPKPGEPRDVDN